MTVISINQRRFDLLRGYYQGGQFHPAGGQGVCLDEFLDLLNFENINGFMKWYLYLAQEEIDEMKKDWCPGNCCQSILVQLKKTKDENGWDVEFWEKVDNTFDMIAEEEAKNNGRLSIDAYRRIFPKCYNRFIKSKTHQDIRQPLTPETKEKFHKETERLNKLQKEYPEPMLWYLYQTGQVTDLTREDIKKINEYVRQRKKEDPHCDMWEINEKETLDYLKKRAEEINRELKEMNFKAVGKDELAKMTKEEQQSYQERFNRAMELNAELVTCALNHGAVSDIQTK